MNDKFEKVSFETFSPIAHAIGDLQSQFCDHTPYVILIWSKYYDSAFATIDGYPILRNTVDGVQCYSPLTKDVVGAVGTLLEYKDSLTLSLLSEEQMKAVSENFAVDSIECDEGWADYVYLHSDLANLVGKRYAGQRNHINKFIASVKSWQYENINSHNISEVLGFYKELTADTSAMDETALYERQRIIEYLSEGFYRLTLSGGLIRADGKIVAFAFGEVINGTLFVHVEKARKDVQGAYQIMVREFALHNPAELINREEDMGIEGLRTSKRSYHPLRLEKKYKMRITKK